MITPIDRFLFHISDGRWKLSAPVIPSLMLFTIGARSGLRRETPLMCFPQPDGTWFICGSNFGMEKHPAWSANLIANPAAQVHYRRSLTTVHATLLSQDEADEIWPTLEQQWPHDRDYEKTARRNIRVFHLVSTEVTT
jgi:deazaflavin-dependent oxidoreductase (nitroreductase family)